MATKQEWQARIEYLRQNSEPDDLFEAIARMLASSTCATYDLDRQLSIVERQRMRNEPDWSAADILRNEG